MEQLVRLPQIIYNPSSILRLLWENFFIAERLKFNYINALSFWKIAKDCVYLHHN